MLETWILASYNHSLQKKTMSCAPNQLQQARTRVMTHARVSKNHSSKHPKWLVKLLITPWTCFCMAATRHFCGLNVYNTRLCLHYCFLVPRSCHPLQTGPDWNRLNIRGRFRQTNHKSLVVCPRWPYAVDVEMIASHWSPETNFLNRRLNLCGQTEAKCVFFLLFIFIFTCLTEQHKIQKCDFNIFFYLLVLSVIPSYSSC